MVTQQLKQPEFDSKMRKETMLPEGALQLQLHGPELALSAAAQYIARNQGSEGFHSNVVKAELGMAVRGNIDQLGPVGIAKKFQRMLE
ncbi:hypothetical protein HY988_01735 [Candidatus Micrarchaeota archaeon]|nr:hypothetical protein [Candidatus Micrarchaeota archaeon]